jgi:hypothetical protein
VTGQDNFAGDVGLLVSIELVNELVVQPTEPPGVAVRRVLAVDPPTLAKLHDDDVLGFAALAARVYDIAVALAAGDVDRGAGLVNQLLAEEPAAPHLAKESGRWVLHHHPAEAPPVPMWTSIAADAQARLIGADRGTRVGCCAADDCGRIYVDVSKNGSRRFCSLTCQNRVKAAAYRARRR